MFIFFKSRDFTGKFFKKPINKVEETPFLLFNLLLQKACKTN